MKNEVTINIEKCSIPIIWLDTSIISNLCTYKISPNKLEKVAQDRLKKIYDYIYSFGRKGKIICPMAEQEQEVWAGREKWLDMMHELSMGIECACLKVIEDKQLNNFSIIYRIILS